MHLQWILLLLLMGIFMLSEAMLIVNNCKACTTQCYNGACKQSCAGSCPGNCQFCSVSCINGVCRENCGDCGGAHPSNATSNFDWKTFNQQMQRFQAQMGNWQTSFQNQMSAFQRNMQNTLSNLFRIFG